MIRFNISKIEFTRRDKEKQIILPIELSSELAELIGIHIGDGSIYYRGRSPEFKYSGNANNEKEYYNHIARLFKKVFNLDVKTICFTNTECGIRFYSKALFLFYTNVLKIPYGNKASIIDIPKNILNSSRETLIACMRGIIDTDFSVHFKKKYKKIKYYPTISAAFASERLVKTLKVLFDNLGFKVLTYTNRKFDSRFGKEIITHSIFLYGKSNLHLWANLIGSNNPKHIDKYNIWKKIGYVPN